MKPTLIESNFLTLSTIQQEFLRENSYSTVDVIVRYTSGDGVKSYIVSSTQTKVIRDSLNEYLDNHQKDIAILNSVIFWQKRTIDFQALHTAFLLNSISEEDFEQESEKFTVRQCRVDPEIIASIINKLDNLLGIDFDTSDYADYFKCTPKNVIEGLRLLRNERLLKKLPSATE